MSDRDSNGEGHVHRHVIVVQLQAYEDAPGYTTCFEPEGGERFIGPGDHLTITFDTSEPQEIEIAMHEQDLIFWRPTRGDVRVSIVDRRSGESVTDLW